MNVRKNPDTSKNHIKNFYIKYKEDIHCLLIFTILLCILFYDPLFTGKAFYLDDIEAYSHPMRQFQYEAAQSGKIPLWNPYQYSGNQFFADSQVGLLYPGNWIFFFVPPERAMVYYIIFHIFLAGMFTYILLRGIGFRRYSCLAGCIFFAFAGPLLVKTVHMIVIAEIAWVPLIIFLTDRLIKFKTISSAALLSVAMAIHILIGYYAFTQIMFILVSIFLLSHLHIKNFFHKEQLRLITLFVAAVILSFTLSAAQLIPSYDFMQQCTRSIGFSSFNEAGSGSLSIGGMVAFFIPDYRGNPLRIPGFAGTNNFWDECCYLGIFPIFLSIFGLFFGPRENKNYKLAFGLMFIFSFIYAFGYNTPFYRLFYEYFPLGKIHHMPIRYVLFMLPGLVYFVASGFESLMETKWAEENQDEIKAVKTEKFMSRLSKIFLILVVIFIVFPPSVRLGGGMKILNTWFTCPVVVPPMTVYTGLIFFIITGSLGLLLISQRVKGRISDKWTKIGALSILIISAFSFGFTWNPTVNLSFYSSRAEQFKDLAHQNPPARVYYTVQRQLIDTYGIPNTQGMSDIVGYNPLMLKDYAFYFLYAKFKRVADGTDIDNMFQCANRFTFDDGVTINVDNDLKQKMVLLLNLQGYYKSKVTKENVFQTEFGKIDNPYKRVFTVDDYKVIKDDAQLLSCLDSKDFDPTKTLLLSEDPSIPHLKDSANPKTESVSHIISYEPDTIKIKVNTDHPTWLFLSEIYCNGWKARIDGKDRKLYKGDYTFRAVHLEPGDKIVEIYFFPDSIKTGFIVSGISTFIIIISIVLSLILSNRLRKSNENISE